MTHRGVYDAAIPHLRRLTRVREATLLLRAAHLSGQHVWKGGGSPELEIRAVTVLRGHPGSRWTLRYLVRWGQAERSIIAKVYARDRYDVATSLSMLRRSGFGADAPMQVPALIAYVPAFRLLLQEEVTGETARVVLLRGRAEVVAPVAKWLAAFHAAALPLPATYTLHDPFSKARRWTRLLQAQAPALTSAAQRLLAALMETQPTWAAAPHLVHGDFSSTHVYLTGHTTTVIDWDSCHVGNCAEDAGRFLASLHHLAIRNPMRGRVVEQAAELFARIYRAAAPLPGRELAFYEALACLHTAKRLTAARRSHRIDRARLLLARGEQALTHSSEVM